jgi:hypothetical protein
MRGGYRQNAGRKKGIATIEAEKARQLICERLTENLGPILDILIKEAKKGDMRAIRELFDRAYGKAPQTPEIMEDGAERKINVVISQAIAEKNGLVSPGYHRNS